MAVKHYSMNEIDWVAHILVILGALNFGLIGAFKLDIVQATLGGSPTLVQLTYILIGLAGLYKLYKLTMMKGKK